MNARRRRTYVDAAKLFLRQLLAHITEKYCYVSRDKYQLSIVTRVNKRGH